MATEDLIGRAEIAEMLGVSTRTATNYMRRDDFPPPYASTAGGRVWRRRDVEKWRRDFYPKIRPGPRPRDSD